MISPLATKSCVPCRGDTPPLSADERRRLLGELGGDWQIQEEHHLYKEYKFKNFLDALAYTNRVGQVAEEEGHHPAIFLTWGKVALKIWTHAIDGLTESDFILAAKADAAH
jgi:4a-hydroxytetrahydrobiopterin dehydratase